MTSCKHLLAAIFGLLLTLNASAATLYVDLNSPDPTPPYSDILSAAHTIQDAVAASTNGDLILVMDGVYDTGAYDIYITPYNRYGLSRVSITNAVTVRSINGPAVTTIQGLQVGSTGNGPDAIRCAYLTNGAILSGFSLTGGATMSTGYCPKGGGVCCASATPIISNCVLRANTAAISAGGAYGGTLLNCLIISNTAGDGGGGAQDWVLTNCLLVGNSATRGGGAFGGYLYNCTVTANSATTYAGGTAGSGLFNSIVYFNTALSQPNYTEPLGLLALFYSCTTPLPLSGVGHFTNAPLFVSPAVGDYRLQANSPCINAGHNKYITNNLDLAQTLRISGGTVDVGAYEFQSPASLLSYVWAQNHGFPTDGSADLLDSDGDGAANYHECFSGTIGTNAASVLKLAAPVRDASGITLTWSGINRKVYYIERTTDLSASWGFEIIKSNWFCNWTGPVSWTDNQATGASPYFYRIGVHQDR